MIELKFSGKCEGCKCADLELLRYETFGEGNRFVVNCKHNAACRKWNNAPAEKKAPARGGRKKKE